MLFLYRPRQTWMPSRMPREVSQQDEYNYRLQQQFQATRRVPPAAPAQATGSGTESSGTLHQLVELHTAGVLTDSEFAAAKARLTG